MSEDNNDSGVWVQISEFRHKWYPTKEAYKRAIGELSSESHVYIIDDTMPGTEHPVTGEVIDSKSRFREVTREHGCIEVGNELLSQSPARKPEGLPKEVVKEAIIRSLDIHGHRSD